MGHPASYADEVGRDLFDGDERTRLCDLLEALGPDAPTVLEPWTARDLAAHLYLRENDPLAGPGLVLPGPWARFAERHQQLAARRDYLQLVARVRSGPRAVFRLGWVRRVPNLNELFVHHEDVRRANGGSRRNLESAMDDALWFNVTNGAWYLARRLRGAGLELRNADTGQTVTARRGDPTVGVTGEPGELLLYLFGASRGRRSRGGRSHGCPRRAQRRQDRCLGTHSHAARRLPASLAARCDRCRAVSSLPARQGREVLEDSIDSHLVLSARAGGPRGAPVSRRSRRLTALSLTGMVRPLVTEPLDHARALG
jgi:uncharacterized protein (TIGR03085 family)